MFLDRPHIHAICFDILNSLTTEGKGGGGGGEGRGGEGRGGVLRENHGTSPQQRPSTLAKARKTQLANR